MYSTFENGSPYHQKKKKWEAKEGRGGGTGHPRDFGSKTWQEIVIVSWFVPKSRQIFLFFFSFELYLLLSNLKKKEVKGLGWKINFIFSNFFLFFFVSAFLFVNFKNKSSWRLRWSIPKKIKWPLPSIKVIKFILRKRKRWVSFAFHFVLAVWKKKRSCISRTYLTLKFHLCFFFVVLNQKKKGIFCEVWIFI